RAANALESSELSIERNAYRRKPQRVRKDWHWIGRAGAIAARKPVGYPCYLNSMRRAATHSWATATMTRHRHCSARELALRIYRDTERARRKDVKTEALQSEVATEQRGVGCPQQGGISCSGRRPVMDRTGFARIIRAQR